MTAYVVPGPTRGEGKPKLVIILYDKKTIYFLEYTPKRGKDQGPCEPLCFLRQQSLESGLTRAGSWLFPSIACCSGTGAHRCVKQSAFGKQPWQGIVECGDCARFAATQTCHACASTSM